MIIIINIIKNMIYINELKKRNDEIQKKLIINKYDMEDILNSLSLRDLTKIKLEKKKIDKETELSWKQKELNELKQQNLAMKNIFNHVRLPRLMINPRGSKFPII